MMTPKHKLQFSIWRLIVAAAMRIPRIAADYNAYSYRAWESGRTAMGEHEWLHRRWRPKKYAYEIQCPTCGGYTTSYGLCMDCGVRFDVTNKPLRPL